MGLWSSIRVRRCLLCLVGVIAFSLCIAQTSPTFTYQGMLQAGGLPANGTFDFRFQLFATAAAITPLAPAITVAGVAVAKGVFTAEVPCDAALFTGAERWLQLSVRPAGAETFTPLAPRQKLTPAPTAAFAYAAGSVPWSGISGAPAQINQPPVVLLTAKPRRVFTTTVVDFDASGSYDPEGGALTYAWDWLGDGTFTAYGPEAAPAHSYPGLAGTYLAAVRVKDAGGRVAEGKVLVTITGAAAQTVATGGAPVGVTLIGGKPVITYSDPATGGVKFAVNSAADGTGTWKNGYLSSATISSTAPLGEITGKPIAACYDAGAQALRVAVGDSNYTAWSLYNVNTYGEGVALAVYNNVPAVAYYSGTALLYSYTSSGYTVWQYSVVDGKGACPALARVNDRAALAYYQFADQDLKFAINTAANGSGTWTKTVVDSTGDVGRSASLALVDGRPAIAYYDATNGDVKFAINSAADGGGTWTISVVDSAGDVGQSVSLAVVHGLPAIAYYDATNGDLKYAVNRAAAGTGAWDCVTVDAAGTVGQSACLTLLDGHAAIAYYDATNQAVKLLREP